MISLLHLKDGQPDKLYTASLEPLENHQWRIQVSFEGAPIGYARTFKRAQLIAYKHRRDMFYYSIGKAS